MLSTSGLYTEDWGWKEDQDRLDDYDDSGLEEQRCSQTIWASARAFQRKQCFIWSRSSAIPMSISLAEDEAETEDKDKPSDRSYSCWKLPKKPHQIWSEKASDVPRHIIPDTDLKKAGTGECNISFCECNCKATCFRLKTKLLGGKTMTSVFYLLCLTPSVWDAGQLKLSLMACLWNGN